MTTKLLAPLAEFVLLAIFAAHAAASPTVVISQVYGGGGNSGAIYNKDFVELHNISDASVNVDGWSIQYASAIGTSWSAASLTGSMAPGAYYLIRLGPVGTTGNDLPAPDLEGSTSINLGSTAGKITLCSSTEELTGLNPLPNPAIMDMVGYGTTASAFEGGSPAIAPSNSTSIARQDSGSRDTDDNWNDFVSGTPAPRNSSSPPYQPPIDTTKPSIVLLSPADNSSGAFATCSLAITYDEGIFVGSGSVVIRKTSDNSVVDTIIVPSSQVWISDASATLDPLVMLEFDTSYYVEMAAGTFKDAANNGTVGIAGNSTWNFTTSSAPRLVISQVYGGGGNSGAAYNNDFVELHNISDAPVNVDGWSVQYASATGPSWSAASLTGSMAPGAYFLIRLGPAGSTGADLPAPDLEGSTTINLGSTAGKITLCSSTEELTGLNPLPNPAIMDMVGYGTAASAFEGGSPAIAPSNSTSIARKDSGSQDTDDNWNDYVSGTPTPRNRSSPPYPPASTFAAWISGCNVGTLTGFNDDCDNDGLGNAMENILGSRPEVSNPGLTAVSTSGGNLVLRHTLATSPATDLTSAYEWSTNLSKWNSSGATADNLTVTFGSPAVIAPGTPNLVEVTATLSGGQAAKVFVRLRVNQN